MNDLNLLKYHGLSLREIFEQLNASDHEEAVETEKVQEQEKTPSKPRKVKKKSGRLIKMMAAALLLFALAGAAYIYILPNIDLNEAKEKVTQLKNKVVETAPETKPGPEKDALEEKGYTKIGQVQFADKPEDKKERDLPVTESKTLASGNIEQEQAEAAPEEEADVPPITVTEEPEPRKLELTKEEYEVRRLEREAERRKQQTAEEKARRERRAKQAKKAKPVVKLYSINFTGLTRAEYDKVKQTVNREGLKLNSSVRNGRSYKVWKLYNITPGADMTIQGRPVKFVKSFGTKDEALAYLNQKNIPSVIRNETEYEKIYTAIVCCAKLEKAKSTVRKTGIKNKVIKIIRQNPK